MFVKKLTLTKIVAPNLIKESEKLIPLGKLAVSLNNLTYLDINDEYIHRLFPFIEEDDVTKPNYFGKNSVGAHITVIYPEENQSAFPEELGVEHRFQIKGAYTGILGLKKYFVLTVNSPSLLQLRRRHGLSDKVCFKNHLIDFHITIGGKIIKNNEEK